jgi:hypothetical protein
MRHLSVGARYVGRESGPSLSSQPSRLYIATYIHPWPPSLRALRPRTRSAAAAPAKQRAIRATGMVCVLVGCPLSTHVFLASLKAISSCPAIPERLIERPRLAGDTSAKPLRLVGEQTAEPARNTVCVNLCLVYVTDIFGVAGVVSRSPHRAETVTLDYPDDFMR